MNGAPKEQRKLAAIMFTDMVGYSALTQRNEALALELLEEHQRLLRGLFPKFYGSEVETTGDGFLVEFASALEASRCAIEIQRAVSTRNLTVPADRQIQLRIGIHVGDVVHKDGHVLGDGVNIAARLQPLAEPGGICISIDVARQVQNNLQATVVKMGQAELKNIRLPMEICRIVLPWEKHAPAPVEPNTLERIKKEEFPTALALVVVALGGMGVWLYYFSGRLAKLETTPQDNVAPPMVRAVEAKSVAVLPFVNMSADKDNEYLSDGITDDLCTALTQVKGLRVPARTSSFAFKGKTDDIRKIGKQLGVTTVLEGSVSKVGNKLRINAQLINVADGFHLWATNYDREMADILDIRSEIAQRVVAALKIQLGVEDTQRLVKKATEHLEAYNFYLLGRYQSAKATEDGLRKGIEHYQQAILVDPAYARAYAGLADAYTILGGVFGFSPPREMFPKAKVAALKALELDDNLAEAHASLADYNFRYAWDWSEAERGFKRSIELDPNYAQVHQAYGGLLQVVQRFDEAIAERKQARRLDPLSPWATANVGFPYYAARQYDQAIAWFKQGLEMDRSFYWAHAWLGQCFVQKGMHAEAISEIEAAIAPSDRNVRVMATLGHAYALSGNRMEAQKILDELLERSKASYVPPYFIAVIYAGFLENDPMFEWLAKAYEERFPYLAWLNVEPVFDPVRSDPRFVGLVKKMGLAK